VNTEPARLAAALNGGQVGATLIEQVEESIPRLRQLDDQQGGGGASLTSVTRCWTASGWREPTSAAASWSRRAKWGGPF
jgi:hypothetical protein